MYNSLCATALAVILATPAFAGNWSIAAPEALPQGGEALKTEVWQFFLREMGPDDWLAVLNSTKAGMIAEMIIPDDPKYNSTKRRARDFAQENANIAGHLDQVADGVPVTDTIGVLRHVALTRIDPAHPLDLMIIGSAVQAFAKTPDLSMQQDEALFVPSLEHLTASVSETDYGMGAEGSDGLANVYLHLCPVADDLRSDEVAALQGFYASYVAARGGTLVTWSDDLPTCFARFSAEVRAPIEVAPYGEATGVLRMVEVGLVEPTVVIETEPTTVIVNGIEVDQFNLFSGAPHPTLVGVEVTTGVVYEPGRYPDIYERAYCYFNVQKSASSLRLDLGDKYPGQRPTWDDASGAALREAGISRSDFEAGRRACQWPNS